MSKRKLLLADDSITIQKVVNLTFADEGIEVISVGDGNSAMDKLREGLPDLVMADVNMPGLNGYEICENIKQTENSKEIPVILLVGSFEPFDEDEAERVGANDYLTKPFQSISQLVDKVSGLLKLEEEDLEDTAEMPSNNGGATHLENDLEEAEPATSKDFRLAGDEFDDEIIQTSQIGSVPVGDAAKFEAGPEKPKIVDDELIEDQPTNLDVSNEESDLQSEMALDDEMASEFSEPFTEVNVEDFNKTQPLTNSDIQEMAIEDDSSESIEFEEYKSSEPATTEVDNNFEDISAELDGEASSEEFVQLEDEKFELPMPEAASVLELDELNLLDLPPLEESSEEAEVAEEPINQEQAIGEKAASYFADEEEKKRFVETSIIGDSSETSNSLDESVSSEMVADITKKVVERLSERAVREIAWEVVPELAELIIKKMVEEKMKD